MDESVTIVDHGERQMSGNACVQTPIYLDMYGDL